MTTRRRRPKTKLKPADYEQDLPKAGSSDRRYSASFEERMQAHIKAQAEAAAAKKRRPR